MTTVDLWGNVAPGPAPAPRAPGRARPLGERQAEKLAKGLHPLSGIGVGGDLALHPNAGSAVDRDGPGRRCGSCVHRTKLSDYAGRSYWKCGVGWEPEDGGYPTFRVSRSAASDVREWWPGCTEHESEADSLRLGGPEERARADELDAEAETARLQRVARTRGPDLVAGLYTVPAAAAAARHELEALTTPSSTGDTPMATTPNRLDEIRNLAATATPGPWTTTAYGHAAACTLVESPEGDTVADCAERPADAAFIAAARTAVPELLAQITDLVRELEKARDALVATEKYLAPYSQANAALHLNEQVHYSPLHARVTAAIAGITAALARVQGGAE